VPAFAVVTGLLAELTASVVVVVAAAAHPNWAEAKTIVETLAAMSNLPTGLTCKRILDSDVFRVHKTQFQGEHTER